MIYQEPLAGNRVVLESILPTDSKLVFHLRSNPENSRFLHKISEDPKDQTDWIKIQNSKDADYYFKVASKKSKVFLGTIGLYEIKDGRAEWGRWVVPNSSRDALESLLLLTFFAFNVLGLDEIYARTHSHNLSVVSLHDKLPYSDRKEGFSDFPYIEHVLVKSEIKGFQEFLSGLCG
jgi:RimJ/RimL family protein N-acetyltransferase